MLLTNAADIEFGTVSAGQSVTISHASIEIVDASKTNRLLWTGRLRADRALVETDPITIPAGDLDVEILPGVLQDAALVAIFGDGIATFDGDFTIRLGTGDMGNAGTTSQPAGATGYTAQTGVELTAQAS